MFLVFEDVPDAGLQIDCGLDLAAATADPEGLHVRGPARLVARASHGTQGLELAGRATATLRLECSRCLEPVERPLSCEFSLILVSEAVEFGAGEMRVSAEDTRVFYAQQGKADLREIVTEQLYLNRPQKVVCRDDCAGLCPTCGVNRNRLECSCRAGDVDPRLAPLLAWTKHGEPET